MSRREGKCYIWIKSDAVSVRRQTQLSCPKDNRLSGQHYTKLRAWRPSGTRRSCWGRGSDARDSDSNSSLFLSLSPLWGHSVRKAGCPKRLIRVNGGKLSVRFSQGYSYDVGSSYNAHHPENKLQWRQQEGILSINVYGVAWCERIMLGTIKELFISYLSPCDKDN